MSDSVINGIVVSFDQLESLYFLAKGSAAENLPDIYGLEIIETSNEDVFIRIGPWQDDDEEEDTDE